MDQAQTQAKMLKRVTYAAVVSALVLIIAKSFALHATHSASVLGALVDSIMDSLASVVNLLAVRHSLQPADSEHRFGHGKAEPLAGLGQTLVISLSALMLGRESLHRLLDPQPIAAALLGSIVMVFSMVVTLLLVTYQKRVVRLTGSTAIRADSLHYQGDFLLHGSVLVGLLSAGNMRFAWVDGAMGMLIAVWLVFGAGRIGWESIQLLMDRELPESERERIFQIVRDHEQVLGAHHLRTRRAGRRTFIQIHIEMPGSLTLNQAHQYAHEIEEQLHLLYPETDVFIHQEPPGIDEPHLL